MGLKVYDNFVYNKVLKKIKSRFSYAKVDVIKGKLIIEVPYEIFTQMNFLGIDSVSPEECKSLNVDKIEYLINYKNNAFVEPFFKSDNIQNAELVVSTAVINSGSLLNNSRINSIRFEFCSLFEEGTLKLKCDSVDFYECNVSKKQKILLESETSTKEYRLLKSGKKIFLGDDNEFKVIYKDGAKIIFVEEGIPAERAYDYLDAYDSRLDFERYVFGYSLTRKESLKTILVLYNNLGCAIFDCGDRNISLCDLSDRFIKADLFDDHFEVNFKKERYDTYGYVFDSDNENDVWYSRENRLSSSTFLSEAKKYISRMDEIIPILTGIVDIDKELNLLKKEVKRVEENLEEGKRIINSEVAKVDISKKRIIIKIFTSSTFTKLLKTPGLSEFSLQKKDFVFDEEKRLLNQRYMQINDTDNKRSCTIAEAARDDKIVLSIRDELNRIEYLLTYERHEDKYNFLKSQFDEKGIIVSAKRYPIEDLYNSDERYLNYFFLNKTEFMQAMNEVRDLLNSLADYSGEKDFMRSVFEKVNTIKKDNSSRKRLY